MLTPGHTPGHQSVRIGGDLVLGADVAYFASGLDDHRFPVYGDDYAEQARSATRLQALRDAGIRVLPGHDPDVLRPGPIAASQTGSPRPAAQPPLDASDREARYRDLRIAAAPPRTHEANLGWTPGPQGRSPAMTSRFRASRSVIAES